MASLYIETHGCQMNEADSRYITERAVSAGYAIVDRVEGANVVVLNTCTVRDSAEQRAYGRLGHYKSLKDRDPTLRLVLCGCLAEQDRELMRRRIPFLDALFGTRELRLMGDTIAGWAGEFGEEEAVEARALVAPMGGRADGLVDAFTPLRAYVNVQRGCSYYCSFCIVPQVRGRFDHRPLTEIETEIAARVAGGAREITLVGQTVNAYLDPGSGLAFAGLLAHVARMPGVERVGFITSHPKDLSDDLIDALAQIPSLNPRLHLALQSGSDPILRRMNRRYTIEGYLERIGRFRAASPDWALTTDIIVGFPGETEGDFERSLAVVDRVGFAQVYAFVYSPRRGTPAAKMEQLDPAVGADRLGRLMGVVNRHVTAYHQRKVGTVVRALAQGPSRKDPAKLSVKTGDNVTVVAPVDGDASRFAATPWLDIQVERAHVWGCVGTLLGVAERASDPRIAVALPVIDLIGL
jgi:tRNA-2-methylthio-N6-dimethylallyladenosine synthase